MKNLNFNNFATLVITGLLLGSVVWGQSVSLPNPLEANSFEELIDSVINIIFYLALLLAPLMVIVAGFLFVTAAGDPNRVTAAKRIILWTAVGFLIVLLSKGIFQAVTGLLSSP